jgi:hypothetical protein
LGTVEMSYAHPFMFLLLLCALTIYLINFVEIRVHFGRPTNETIAIFLVGPSKLVAALVESAIAGVQGILV